jgi:AcrR family transcriptional regulator
MSATRETLLNVAYDAMVAGAWPATRMADLAVCAGVSRQTLYNEFGTRDALAQAVSVRETERFLSAVEDAIADADQAGPVAAVAAAVTVALQLAADNPLTKAALTDDTAGLLPYLTTRAEPVLAAARARIHSHLLDHFPALPPAEVDHVAEAVVRLTVSYLVVPSDRADATAEAVGSDVAHLVERLLVPRRPGGPDPQSTVRMSDPRKEAIA